MKTAGLFSKLIFRRAIESDLVEIIKLLMEDELGKTRELLDQATIGLYEAAFQKIDHDPNHNLMVIEWEGEIIGTVHLTLLPSLTLRGSLRLQVEAVRVAEKMRGEGIGAWMFQQIFEYAKKENVAIIQLTTDKKRERAKKFYEGLGFEATHEGMKKYRRSNG
ncbi:MAG: GNAT family N-acetyltransferase [Chthoniobacterales bacterium]|nr:GNAT family N-acetyltransferase [Chthoniobacterales bacterium]